MEIRKSIEANFLTCKHCHQPYKQPKALVCLHSFCQSCLEDIISKRKANEEAKEIEALKLLYKSSNTSEYASGYRRKWSSRFRYGDYSSSLYTSSRYNRPVSTKDDVITCPICNKDTIVPSGGVTSLPADQLADKLASMVDRMPNFPVCDVCTKEPLLTDSHLNGIKSSQSSLSTRFKQSRYTDFNRYVSNDDTLSEYDSDAEDEGVSLDKLSMQDSVDNSEALSPQTTRASTHHHKDRDQKHLRKSLTSSRRRDDSFGPKPASAACLECGKRLCAYCQEAHSRMPVTASHVLIQVEQMEQLRCDRHPQKMLCTGHADHDILSMRQAVAAYQDQLNLKSAETQSHMSQIEVFLTGLQICENEMRQLRTMIEDTAMAYIDRIHLQRAKLCEQVDKLVGIELDQITTECNRLTNATAAWYNFINDDCVTSRLDLLDPIEALTEAGPILDRLNRCLQLASSSMLTSPEWQLFLSQLTIAEKAVQSTQKTSYSLEDRNGDTDKSENSSDEKDLLIEDPRIEFWRSRIGHFQSGEVNLGRIVTPSQLAAEAKVKAAQFVSTHVQTGPELIKTLPPPKGTLLHRAIQVDLLSANLDDRGTQTETPTTSNVFHFKVDVGTQYLSSDVNPPVSIYRSIKQILVQK
ncbi:unnamed protein product [Heterobilharzia americana]|nr:unnamed protein product [Heterobilharzia americana]